MRSRKGRKRNPNPFDLVEIDVDKCLAENELQVYLEIEVQGRARRKWIPRGSIIDQIGTTLCVVGDNIKTGKSYFTIKLPYHYAKGRGLVE